MRLGGNRYGVWSEVIVNVLANALHLYSAVSAGIIYLPGRYFFICTLNTKIFCGTRSLIRARHELETEPESSFRKWELGELLFSILETLEFRY